MNTDPLICFYELMIKNGMNEEISLVCEELLENGLDHNTSFCWEVLFSSANHFSYQLKFDLNLLIKQFCEKMEKPKNYVDLLNPLIQILSLNQKIDTKNEFVIKLFKILLRKSNDDQYIFEVLRLLVFQMKYDSRPWLEQMVQVSISTVKKYLSNGIHEIQSYFFPRFILSVIRTFEENIERFISGTNFVDMMIDITKKVSSNYFI